MLICSSLIHSDRSDQMSDCEQFAQIAQEKWATVSDSLRSLMINEQMSELPDFLSKSLIISLAHKKQVIRSKNLTKILFFGTFKKNDSSFALF